MIKNYLFRDKYSLLILFVSFIISSSMMNYWFVLPGILLLFLNKQASVAYKGRIDKDLLLLLFVFASYSVFALLNNNTNLTTIVTRSLPAVLFFAVGFNLASKNKKATYCYFILLLAAFFTSFINIYNGLIDTAQNGFIVPERMFGRDREEFTQTTSLIVSELIPTIACIGLFFDKPNLIDDKRLRWFAFALGILGELCAIHYVSRAGILIMALSIITGLIYRSKINFRTIFFISITILAYLSFLQTDAYAVFELKNETGGDLATGNGRDERMLYWLNRIIENPIGIVNWQNQYSQYSWAHNFWLDFTKECGIIPGIALVLFSLRNLYYVVRIAINRHINKSVAQLVLLLGIAYFLTLFTEPTMQGAPLLMFSYLFFCGIVKSIYKNGKGIK